MTVECPACKTRFPVDPRKVPPEGVFARCSTCQEVFFVSAEPQPVDPLPEAVPVAEEPAGADEDWSPEVVQVQDEDTALEEGAGRYEEDLAQADDASFEEETGAYEEEAVQADDASFAEETAAYEEEVVQADDASFEEEDLTFSDSFGGGGPAEEEPAFEAESPEEWVAEPEPEASDATSTPEVFTAPPQFGKRDPGEKAQRLARVLVSDIILYNPDRHQSALESDRLKEEFDEEIDKSWNEYVEQVGEELAGSTTHFKDALNEILAKGKQIF